MRNTSLCAVFSVLFLVFGNVLKHSLACFKYLKTYFIQKKVKFSCLIKEGKEIFLLFVKKMRGEDHDGGGPS